MTATVRALTVAEVAYINNRLTHHDLVRKHLDGLHRVRDPELLASAVGQPYVTAFGADAYPTLNDKAAVLLYGIARNHPFADGNKRTATVAALMLLTVNGRRVTWDAAEALERIVAVAEGTQPYADFAAWITTEICDPLPEPDAEADKQLIEQLIQAHAWLITALAER
jgi:death on curing protein